MPVLTPEQWFLGTLAALLVGISKTGLPGTGILIVPLMAEAFGGRLSVGTVLPMLILGDCFAVAWYRHHGRWDKIISLVPWVLLGLLAGGIFLDVEHVHHAGRDPLNVLIGVLVLGMLVIHLARSHWGDRFAPTSPAGVCATGTMAGFTTMVSNAAGPIMAIYLQATGLQKKEFMGTTAWYFFTFNIAKLPILILVSLHHPENPLVTHGSAAFNVAMIPVILVGAFAGRWLLPRMPQKLFDNIVLTLAGIAAVKLLLG